jgi:integrase
MSVFKRECWRCEDKKKCPHKASWYYDFGIRGKRFKGSIPEARTKAQAEQAESKLRDDVYQGRYGREPSNIRLREFVEKQFLPWSRAEKRSWRNDYARIKPILAFFKGKMMRDIGEIQVRTYKKERLGSINKRGTLYAPASVDRELQLLSRIFSLAIERGLVAQNPCKGVKKCSVGNTVTNYMTDEEEARLRLFLTGRRAHLADILTIDLYTGMRRTELLSLHKSQIDFSRGIITLTKTKNNKPRNIPIHPDIAEILMRRCANAGPNGFLFESPRTGRPIIDIKTAWRAALKAAGLRHIPFHCAGRHTFGTRAAEGGAHVKDIQEIMDHADIRTTMRYVHATEEGKRRAIEAASRVSQTSHKLKAVK